MRSSPDDRKLVWNSKVSSRITEISRKFRIYRSVISFPRRHPPSEDFPRRSILNNVIRKWSMKITRSIGWNKIQVPRNWTESWTNEIKGLNVGFSSSKKILFSFFFHTIEFNLFLREISNDEQADNFEKIFRLNLCNFFIIIFFFFL